MQRRIGLSELWLTLNRSPRQLRRWFNDPAYSRYAAKILLQRDQSGRLYATEASVAAWERHHKQRAFA